MKSLSLVVVSTLIFAIGLVMIFSTTSAEVLDHDLGQSMKHALLKQIYYACAGIGIGLFIYKMGYRNILKYSPELLIFFSILLILTLVPGIGRQVNGSKRWLALGGFSFQPSEFVKYIVPAFFINRMLLPKKRLVDFPLISKYCNFQNLSFELKYFLQTVLFCGIPIFLIMIEPNNGTAAVIAMSIVVLCMLMNVSMKFWAVPLACFVVLGGIFAMNLPYVKARLNVYLNPELDLKGKGHQPYQAKIAAGSGHLFGKGPGNSLQKLSYLPEAQNDYIAAIYAEEFGFLGMMVLITLYMLFGLCGFWITLCAPNKSAFYFSGAVTFLIAFQAFLNLGVVSGLLPSTGLNLPFFSQGGTNLIANIMGIAILLTINKEKKLMVIN